MVFKNWPENVEFLLDFLLVQILWALNLGIISEINEKYMEKAIEMGKQYEALPYESLAYIKELTRGKNRDLFDREKEYFGNMFKTENQREGARAFIEKRKANFNTKINNSLFE